MINNETENKDLEKESKKKSSRRDFFVMGATAVACVGAGAAAIPVITSLKPDKSVLAAGTTEVELSNIKEGETVTVMWRGKPIFVTRRTDEEIKLAEDVNLSELKDPESDEDRVKSGKAHWLVTIGICTHLGCVPIGNKGDFGGWFCPCHGSHYDSSGRVRKGPAPKNLAIPPYEFINDTKIMIG
ncbi:MAG: ubiquinol-cytochrome c reductase iron-sulfur subunit [Candidatus Midichloriaceae bacterium]|jgi:ubiquinol-cytochrome c reductase iron-sulfur subunit